MTKTLNAGLYFPIMSPDPHTHLPCNNPWSSDSSLSLIVQCPINIQIDMLDTSSIVLWLYSSAIKQHSWPVIKEIQQSNNQTKSYCVDNPVASWLILSYELQSSISADSSFVFVPNYLNNQQLLNAPHNSLLSKYMQFCAKTKIRHWLFN